METLAGDSTPKTLGLESAAIPIPISTDSGDGGGAAKTLAPDCCDAKTLASAELEGDGGGDVGDVKGGNFGGYVAGDLVWGKIRGKQWWPAMIAEPSSAADRGMVVDVEGGDGESLVLSYFGGEGFGWCNVAQVRPFVEVFGEMVKQSKSKGFVSAVGEAVKEVRLRAEVQITCECVPMEARGEIGSVRVARVKEGIMKPVEVVGLLRSAACDVKVVNRVEVGLLRSWVIGFGKGWSNGLPGYQQRHGIEELVDNVDDLDVLLGALSGGKEVEKDVSSLGARKRGECSFLKDKSNKSNVKKKSMTKLIAEMDLDTVELSDGEDPKVEEKTGSKKRSVKGKPGVDNGKDLDVEESDDVKAEEETASGRRERKRSKYLSPPYTNLAARDISSLSLPKSADVKSESAVEEDITSALLKLDNTSTLDILLELRYMAIDPLYLKKSELAEMIRAFITKYRNSMYSSGFAFVKCQTEPAESCEDLKSPICAPENSPRQGKSNIKSSKRKNQSKDNPEKDLSPDSVDLSQKSKTVRKRKVAGNRAEGKKFKVMDSQIVNVPVVSRYENIKSKNGDLKENSTLFYEPTKSQQPSKEGEAVLTGDEMSKGSSPVGHGTQVGKSGPKKKKATVGPTQMDLGQIQRTNEDSTENRYPGALLMNFPAGVSLPTRDEVISTFSKYGVIIESETELQEETGFARVVFAKSTDAEKAYNSSDKTGIFCLPHVTYRLRYLPPMTSSPPTTPYQKPPLPFIRENLERMISTLTSSASSLKDVSPLEGLKPETKENLVGDMEGLLKKVNMMLNGHAAGASS